MTTIIILPRRNFLEEDLSFLKAKTFDRAIIIGHQVISDIKSYSGDIKDFYYSKSDIKQIRILLAERQIKNLLLEDGFDVATVIDANQLNTMIDNKISRALYDDVISKFTKNIIWL